MTKRELAASLCGLIVGETNDPLRHIDVHIVEPESKSRRIVVDQIRELGGQSVVLGKKLVFADAWPHLSHYRYRLPKNI